MPRGSSCCADGYTFVAMLLVLALVSLGLARAGPVWSHHAQRDRERELLRVGVLYAQALSSYVAASPGSDKSHPTSLRELLLDPRFLSVRRHLRSLYPDPLNPAQPWGLVRNEAGRIVGVYSMSAAKPVAESEVRLDDRVLPIATRYSDWKFLAQVVP